MKKVLKRVFAFFMAVVLLAGVLPTETRRVKAADLVKIPYNESLISAVGVQGTNQCMAYALAYCRTILDGKVHAGAEYWDGTQAVYVSANYKMSGSKNKQTTLKFIYDEINNNRPVCLHVTGQYRTKNWANSYWGHWVAVVGYRTNANVNSLKESDFYILDPGTCSGDYLIDNCSNYTGDELRVSNMAGRPSTPAPTPTYTSSFPLSNNGIYKITSVLSGKVMEVSTGSSQNSKQINLWTYDNSAWMQWKAVQHSDGYSFINVHTGKALDITGGSAAEGTQVAQYDYLASDAQRFKLVDKGNGRYGMIAVCSNLAVDVYASRTNDGATLEQYAFHGGDNQLWTFEPVGDVENTIYSSIYSDGISSTDATIHAILASDINVSDEGFYISTNANMSGSKKISEGLNVKLLRGSDIYYNMNKWYGTLSAGTTYYYQFYVVSGGNEFKSKVQSFTTVSIGDVEAPVITSVVISKVDKTGYTVTATATDNVGVANMYFPTKPLNQGDDAWKGDQGTRQADGSYSYRVNVSDFDNVDGTYLTHVYAFDEAGNYSLKEVQQYVDTTPPVISDIKVSDIDGTGYTVTCTVTDNNGVDRVVFPTWTDYNWQDDLPEDWYNDSTTRGAQNGNQFSIRINTSDHNYERGKYYTHIYAYDKAGNYVVYTTRIVNINNEGKVVSETSYEGHVYQLFDDNLTWQEAKEACEAKGGHLVTITSHEEQKIVESLLPGTTTCSGYFIGGYTENGQSKWVTGEPFNYLHWIDGQPDGWNGTEEENSYVMCSDAYGKACVGWWNDIVGTKPGYGYICEFETVKVTGIDLSENSVSLNRGETKKISAVVVSESGYSAPVSWSSDDEAVAVVKNGNITGIGAGSTKIWAECEGQRVSCTVTVSVPITDISLNMKQKSMFKGETCQLTANVYPSDTTEEKRFIWKSSNPNIANVDDFGKVTAYSAGTAEISVAMANNADLKAVCEVTVKSCIVSFDTMGGTDIDAVECGIGERLVLIETLVREGYIFTGWYKDTACTILWNAERDLVTGNLTLYAGWEKYSEGLWIASIPAQSYTGKAIKPEICVYHNNVKLELGKDYSVKYKNNIKANEDVTSSKAPTVIVTGKGNYAGKDSAAFAILPKDLQDASISADDVFAFYDGYVKNAKVVVKDNRQTLKAGRDYYIQDDVYIDGPGIYQLTLVGMGNYTGIRYVQYTISVNTLISKAKVSRVDAQSYTGSEIKPSIEVKHNGMTLVEDEDYLVTYENNINVGTATAIIKGINNYSGQKKVNFKIEGIPIRTVTIGGIEDVVYDGKIKEQNGLAIMSQNGILLTKGVDYTVSYKNNKNAGTASITITGLNEYSGSVRKSFKIMKYDILSDAEGLCSIEDNELTVSYEKGEQNRTLRFDLMESYWKEIRTIPCHIRRIMRLQVKVVRQLW